MKHPRLQLNKCAFWCGVAVLAVLRCGLTGVQQAYTWVGRYGRCSACSSASHTGKNIALDKVR